MIILASASPRRQELLSLICEDFCVEPADIDETVSSVIEPEKIPELLAIQKAEHIFAKGHYDDIVIGCDTGVFADNIMLGKPKSKDDACRMLSMLSDREHKVITGCAIFYKDKMLSFSDETYVDFYPLTNDEITAYVNTGEPMDKAGAYGIQGKGTVLVRKINGDFYNVVGLPVARLKREIDKLLKT